jgi:hypothetical protein
MKTSVNQFLGDVLQYSLLINFFGSATLICGDV